MHPMLDIKKVFLVSYQYQPLEQTSSNFSFLRNLVIKQFKDVTLIIHKNNQGQKNNNKTLNLALNHRRQLTFIPNENSMAEARKL